MIVLTIVGGLVVGLLAAGILYAAACSIVKHLADIDGVDRELEVLRARLDALEEEEDVSEN